MTITVVPATPDRFDDVTIALNTACLCQSWRMTSSEYANSLPKVRAEALRRQLAETPAPGLLAYEDGEPAGWVGFAPRERSGRLARSKTIPRIDDVPVWAIYCFTVRVGHRRRGIAHALLDGVIAYAREHDVPALEAYPVVTGGRRIHATAAYHGTAGMFTRAGFRKVAATTAQADHLPRCVMRLDLAG